MALITEDGTGRADAESYVSLADASTYAVAHGLTFPITGTDQIPAEQALRRATTWIDFAFRGGFAGFRKTLRVQALEWPRRGAYDIHGYLIDESELPRELIAATVEAAVRELAKPGSLNPDVIPGQIKKRVSVAGAVDVEYAIGAGTAQEQQPMIAVINGILSPLLVGQRSSLFGEARRT
jgi:hypothetical protein